MEGNEMESMLAAVIMPVIVVIIVAVAAVVMVRYTMNGTESAHKASLLSAIAEVIRAIRGKK
ncbi:hypothetical protein [Streptomyces afghaniensis]|uniref:hypothetical protein n=1 Tax=Streptomyces afghaniensis TaxID=66865 RepID=UPI0037A76CFF